MMLQFPGGGGPPSPGVLDVLVVIVVVAIAGYGLYWTLKRR